MDDLKKLEKEALAKKLAELEASEEMKKLKQKQAKIEDEIARLQKRETEKERRERNHRLIFLGATVEKIWGGPIIENSKELECLIQYLPTIKNFFEEGSHMDE